MGDLLKLKVFNKIPHAECSLTASKKLDAIKALNSYRKMLVYEIECCELSKGRCDSLYSKIMTVDKSMFLISQKFESMP